MSISFESALNGHDKALGFRAQRAEVLANNMANADTPNFKARLAESGFRWPPPATIAFPPHRNGAKP